MPQTTTLPKSTTESSSSSRSSSSSTLSDPLSTHELTDPLTSSAPVTYVKDRPTKPSSLKGRDEHGNSLTAHHIYPWNKIRDDLNGACNSGSKSEMQKLLTFADFTVDSEFWEDFAKSPSARSSTFTATVNSLAAAACWSPDNVFMGPRSDHRTDDPGEDLDTSYSKSGMPSPASALGELTARDGGIGKRSGLSEMLARNVRKASGGEAEAYDSSKWDSTTGSIGKGQKKRDVTLRARKGKMDNPYTGSD